MAFIVLGGFGAHNGHRLLPSSLISREQFIVPGKTCPQRERIWETSPVARKLFALLRFLPGSGIRVLLGCRPADTPQQSHRTAEASGPAGRSCAVTSSQCQAEAAMCPKTRWSWSVGAQPGSAERHRAGDGEQSGVKARPGSPLLWGTRRTSFPSMAEVPRASGDGASAVSPSHRGIKPKHPLTLQNRAKSNSSFQTCIFAASWLPP